MTNTPSPRARPVYLTMPPISPRPGEFLKGTILLAFGFVSVFATGIITGHIHESAENDLAREESVAISFNKQIIRAKQMREDYEDEMKRKLGEFYNVPVTQTTAPPTFEQYKKNKSAVWTRR